MTGQELLDGAEKRISEHRTADVQLSITDPKGNALSAFTGRVRLKRHQFKLGCNAFLVGQIEDAQLQQAYQERFSSLLNYATLPFYWGGYEPEKGKTSEDRLQPMADWCCSSGIITKGHPLVWHEVWPEWANELDDSESLHLLEQRVQSIVSRFKGLIDIWDVVNEATVSQRFKNAVGRWIKEKGAAYCVGKALAWAHEAGPDATLLYNDFNVGDDFENLVRSLLDSSAPVHTIGIQSHMHKDTWPLEKVWDVCETYARFGLPLHFTETTILSGRLKASDDDDWHKRHTDWHSTPEGESTQEEYGRKFYTLLFSHPAVEAVTWWDFSDYSSWQGAPAGLVGPDMSPKPLYNALADMFGRHWTTDEEIIANASGSCRLQCFFGDYEIEGTTQSGRAVSGTFRVERGGKTAITLALE